MELYEKEIQIPKAEGNQELLSHIPDAVSNQLKPNEIPIRFVITSTCENNYHCELGILTGTNGFSVPEDMSIFNFKKRHFENTDQFNAVLLIPTGIGAEIGGHSGDGGPIARLLASACDTLITHPNVVNAADINEMPENSLYVEGSVISRFMMGTVGLQKIRSNRVLLVVDKHDDHFFEDAAVNSASLARASMGLDCPGVIQMDERVWMLSQYSKSGRAVGSIKNLEYLLELLEDYKNHYDAIALTSNIIVPEHFHEEYFKGDDMVNPWGGIEAMLTHAISLLLNVPSAHSPMATSKQTQNIDVGVVDPRKSADAVSTTYLHCILKGLHKSPRIIDNPPFIHGQSGLLTVSDVSCLVIPDGCIGLPTLAALEQGIPVIAVKENKNRMENNLEKLPFAPGKLYIVDNYLEAVGVMHVLKAGVSLESVRRPLESTVVFGNPKNKGIDILVEEKESMEKNPPVLKPIPEDNSQLLK